MSKIFHLSQRDYIHGLIMTVGGALTGALLKILEGGLSFSREDLNFVLLAGLVAGLTYIQKKFFSDEEGKLGGKL